MDPLKVPPRARAARRTPAAAAHDIDHNQRHTWTRGEQPPMSCEMDANNLGLTVPRDNAAAMAQFEELLIKGKAESLIYMISGMVIIPTLHTLFRRIIAPWLFGNRFETLSENYKVIVSHHATEFVCGLVASPVMSLCMCRILLCRPDAVWAGDTIRLVMMSGGIAIYCGYSGELAGRLVSTRPLMTVHHYMTFAFLLLLVHDTSELILAVSAMLGLFAVLEWPLFAGLVAYRIYPERAMTKWLLTIAIGFYALTRLAQVAIFITLVTQLDLSTVSAFMKWWVLGGGTFLLILQLYTVVIYAKILQRLKTKAGTPPAAAGSVSTPLSRMNSLRYPSADILQLKSPSTEMNKESSPILGPSPPRLVDVKILSGTEDTTNTPPLTSSGPPTIDPVLETNDPGCQHRDSAKQAHLSS
jgi:hypothetical protein